VNNLNLERTTVEVRNELTLFSVLPDMLVQATWQAISSFVDFPTGKSTTSFFEGLSARAAGPRIHQSELSRMNGNEMNRGRKRVEKIE
jgi:hypothetical protein